MGTPQVEPATGVNKHRVHNVLARLIQLVGIVSRCRGICKALWFAGFLFAKSNTNSESLFMLLLAVMIYLLSSLSV